MPENLVTNVGEREFDNLFAGGVQDVVVVPIVVNAGRSYVRGSVVALDADGKAVLVDSAGTGSVRNPYGILTDDIDATTEDLRTTAYVTGEFNQDALVFGGTDTFATHKTAMRNIGLILKETQDA